MSEFVKTALCQFCGQMMQISAEEQLTQPQAEEQATMSCNCDAAVEYQKEKQRKEKAMKKLPANHNIRVEKDILDKLKKHYGDDRIKVVQKRIESF